MFDKNLFIRFLNFNSGLSYREDFSHRKMIYLGVEKKQQRANSYPPNFLCTSVLYAGTAFFAWNPISLMNMVKLSKLIELHIPYLVSRLTESDACVRELFFD